MKQIPVNKMVIFFAAGFQLTEHFFLQKDEITVFPVNSFWKILPDVDNQKMEVILQNCQDKSKKTVSYAKLVRIFSMQADEIVIMEEKDVPIIIKID
ncbi:MAG: hypothetical protein HY931_00750 [Candidatus Falkowbacteria bacterium]|nr:MAG: hypothetical protein HY931_00750 [Candidatus Falkowbacteria bacterium]